MPGNSLGHTDWYHWAYKWPLWIRSQFRSDSCCSCVFKIRLRCLSHKACNGLGLLQHELENITTTEHPTIEAGVVTKHSSMGVRRLIICCGSFSSGDIGSPEKISRRGNRNLKHAFIIPGWFSMEIGTEEGGGRLPALESRSRGMRWWLFLFLLQHPCISAAKYFVTVTIFNWVLRKKTKLASTDLRRRTSASDIQNRFLSRWPPFPSLPSPQTMVKLSLASPKGLSPPVFSINPLHSSMSR